MIHEVNGVENPRIGRSQIVRGRPTVPVGQWLGLAARNTLLAVARITPAEYTLCSG